MSRITNCAAILPTIKNYCYFIRDVNRLKANELNADYHMLFFTMIIFKHYYFYLKLSNKVIINYVP